MNAPISDELVIDARDVSKVFGEGALAFYALKSVTFQVHRGELVMLAGPSGSGKTTLLSILGCVLSATSGDILVDGLNISKVSHKSLSSLRLNRIGFIFQGHNLISSLNARDNISLMLELQGQSRKTALYEADLILERVGLGDKRHRLPAELSGGQRQRVAIARALVGNPSIILADEPTAALDAHSGLIVTEILREIAKERHGTVVVVTHDNRIFHLADRIVHIEDGQIIPSEGVNS